MMNIRSVLRRSETLVGLVRDSRNVAQTLRNITSKRPQPCDGVVLQEYLAKHRVHKLHIGAGDGALAGWLNTDIDPGADDIFFLDVTKPFPFAGNMFDYVYSEHMIEHIRRLEDEVIDTEMRGMLNHNSTH